MSQAEELLRTLAEGDDEAELYDYSVTINGTTFTAPEPHITVGTDRVIMVPERLKCLGVKNEHNIETVTFDCVRYWDNHDMSDMRIYIVYKTLNGTPEKKLATNITTAGDIMSFDWVISRNVTAEAGAITFQVCVNKLTGGKETTHWNSFPNDECHIADGLDCSTEATELDQEDIIGDIFDRLDEVERVTDLSWKTDLEARMAEVVERVEDAEELVDLEWKAQITEDVADLDNVKTSVADITERVIELEESDADFETRVTVLESSKTSVETRVSALETADTNFDNRAAAIESRTTALESGKTSLEGRATALEAADTALGTRVATLESSKTSLEAADTALGTRVATLESSKASLEGRVTALENNKYDSDDLSTIVAAVIEALPTAESASF